MSSFPTIRAFREEWRAHLFQSAVAHELISNNELISREDVGYIPFQSAVAHELISNEKAARDASMHPSVSKRCRA